jgi:hypothetical protein
LLPQRDQRVEHAVLLRLAKGSESFPEGGYKSGDLQVVWFLKARYQWLLVHGVIHPASHGTLLLIEPICLLRVRVRGLRLNTRLASGEGRLVTHDSPLVKSG